MWIERRFVGALSSVGVGLAGAFQRDLILRDFAAFAYRWSLGMRIGLGLCRGLRDLAGLNRMRAVDWSDHGGLLRNRSAGNERTLWGQASPW